MSSSTKTSGPEYKKAKLFNYRRYLRFSRLLLVFPTKNSSILLMPKVGTTTIKQLVLQSFFKTQMDDGTLPTIHRGIKLISNAAVNMETSLVDASQVNPDFRRFVFVRNPYDRLLSAYKSKFEKMDKNSKVYQRQLGPLTRFAKKKGLVSEVGNSPVPFDTFVRWVVKTNHANMNIHWALQTHLCMSNVVEYTDLHKYEDNFERRVREMMAHLGATDEQIDTGLKRPMNKSLKVSSQEYNGELAEMVYDKFRMDFERFDYSEDSWKK